MLEGHDASNPFFLYLPFNAPHWPLHAYEEDIAKYEGKYMDGWPALREERHKRMLDMGLIDERFELSPQDPAAADWDSLDEETKREMDRKMAIYAAMIDRMDQNIGRVLEHLENRGELDNTLIFFLADNGACHEIGALGHNFRPDLTGPIGTVNSYHSYGRSWSNASNTPFRMHKHWIHEGGIASPLIVHWPEGFQSKNEYRRQTSHVIDIMATIVDVTGANYPRKYRGNAIHPMEGESLRPVFGEDRDEPRTLYWEHFGNRGIRDANWKLVATDNGSWALHDMENDPTELADLKQEQSALAEHLLHKWRAWAGRIGVHGLDELAEIDTSASG